MIVCKNCGTIFEEIYQTCPRCGTVHQFRTNENYDLPRRRMPGEPEFRNSAKASSQHLELDLKASEKKRSKAPTVIVILIAFALMIAVAVTLVVFFSNNNNEQSSGVPKTESEEQLTPPQSIPEDSLSDDLSSGQNSIMDTGTELTSSEDPVDKTDLPAEVTKIEPYEEAYTDDDNTYHEATFKVFISYTFDNNNYEIEWGIYPFSEYIIGDHITITIDPENPTEILNIL